MVTGHKLKTRQGKTNPNWQILNVTHIKHNRKTMRNMDGMSVHKYSIFTDAKQQGRNLLLINTYCDKINMSLQANK